MPHRAPIRMSHLPSVIRLEPSRVRPRLIRRTKEIQRLREEGGENGVNREFWYFVRSDALVSESK